MEFGKRNDSQLQMRQRLASCKKSFKLSNMSIKRTDLEKLLNHLRGAVRILESELEPITVPPEIAAEVAKKMEARICLAWEHQIPEGENARRGLCHTDYNTTMQRIARGVLSEREAMEKGELGPPGKRGRVAARDVAAEKAEKARKVAEDVEKYRKKKGKPDA